MSAVVEDDDFTVAMTVNSDTSSSGVCVRPTATSRQQVLSRVKRFRFLAAASSSRLRRRRRDTDVKMPPAAGDCVAYYASDDGSSGPNTVDEADFVECDEHGRMRRGHVAWDELELLRHGLIDCCEHGHLEHKALGHSNQQPSTSSAAAVKTASADCCVRFLAGEARCRRLLGGGVLTSVEKDGQRISYLEWDAENWLYLEKNAVGSLLCSSQSVSDGDEPKIRQIQVNHDDDDNVDADGPTDERV